jgi:hypothetical protein
MMVVGAGSACADQVDGTTDVVDTGIISLPCAIGEGISQDDTGNDQRYSNDQGSLIDIHGRSFLSNVQTAKDPFVARFPPGNASQRTGDG